MSASPVPPGAPLDLDAIEARVNAATPGPWAWANTCEKGYGANVGAGVFAEGDDHCETPLSGDLSEREDDYYVDEPIAELGHQRAGSDAAFIAHARTDIPALCAEVRRLRAALEEVRARDAEIARLRELFAEPHFMGAPAMAGGGFDESVVMVSRAWYTRLAALALTGEPGTTAGGDTDA